MLALKFAVKSGKLNICTRNSFASTLITSQTNKIQGKHESYQMVGNMNLDHRYEFRPQHLLYPTPCVQNVVLSTSFPSEGPTDGLRFTVQSLVSAGTFLTSQTHLLGTTLTETYLTGTLLTELYTHFLFSFPPSALLRKAAVL